MIRQTKRIRLIAEPAFFFNSFILILNTLAGSFFGYAFWWIISRQFDPLALGIASGLFSAIAMVAALADMGLGVALVRYVHSLEKQQNGFINSCILAISFFAFLFSFGFMIIFWAGDGSVEIRSEALSSSLVFILSSVFFSLAQFLDRIFVAYEVTIFLFFRNLILNITRVAVLFFLVKTYGVPGIILSIGIGSAVSLIFSLKSLVPKAFADFNFLGDFSWRHVRRYATFSLGNHVAQLAWSIPVYLLPVLVLGVFGSMVNGQFYLTWMVANFVYVIPGAISTVAFARFANQERLDINVFRKILGFTLFLLIPAVLAVLLGSPLILGWFGRSYFADGKVLLVWLLLAGFPYAVNSFAVVSFRMQEKVRAVILLSGIILLASLALLLVLGKVWGLTGLGIGWFFAQLFGCLWLAVRVLLTRKRPLSRQLRVAQNPNATIKWS